MAGILRPTSELDDGEISQYLRIQFQAVEIDDQLNANVTWIPAIPCSEVYGDVDKDEDDEKFFADTFGDANWLCPNVKNFKVRGNCLLSYGS